MRLEALVTVSFQAPLKAKGGDGRAVCCRPAQSGHDQAGVSETYQMNAILCPDNKGQSPKARRSPAQGPSPG